MKDKDEVSQYSSVKVVVPDDEYRLEVIRELVKGKMEEKSNIPDLKPLGE